METCPPGETQGTVKEEKMIRVSIYWYTRSLKKHRGIINLPFSSLLELQQQIYGWLITVSGHKLFNNNTVFNEIK